MTIDDYNGIPMEQTTETNYNYNVGGEVKKTVPFTKELREWLLMFKSRGIRFADTIDELRLFTKHENKQMFGVIENGSIYQYQIVTTPDDGENSIKPDNVYSYNTGRWIKVLSFSTDMQPLSKVVTVNYNFVSDYPDGRIFKTAENAQTWITANGGILSDSNTWTIKLPSGLITEPLTKLPFIEFEVSTGTIIDELTSGVAYSTDADLPKAIMVNAQINTLVIPSGTCAVLFNCITNSIEIEDDTSRLVVQGGFHADLDLGNSDCTFDNVRINGNIFSNFNNADFTRSTIQNNVTIASGETLKLVDSVCKSITNNGTLKNYQPTYGCSLTADESTKGLRRYTETANSSSFEMVMKTGASTYEWVKIKENTWQ